MLKRIIVFVVLYLLALPVLADSGQYANSDGGSSLVKQMAQQNMADPNTVLAPPFVQPNANYSTSQFWGSDLAANFFNWLNQKFAEWSNQVFGGYLPATVAALSSAVKSFFLNPDLTQLAPQSSQSGDLAYLFKQLAGIIYGIAIDLLFVLFVLSIWQYWLKASWRGNMSAMTAVGRLIVTMGMVLAWPSIYSFEIALSNQMINAIFVNSIDQLHLFDMAMANMINISAYSGLLGALMKNPAVAVGVASFSGFISALAALSLCILAIILIYELIYLLILKAMQTALLTAQYVFAPVFLIFFATPGTENMASGYIRTFAETSLWSFIWIGLLKILLILIYSNVNPWGKIITAIGVLQLMMRVPQFLGKFKISPASDFINPNFFTSGLQKSATEYARQATVYKDQWLSSFAGMFKATSPMSAASAAGNTMSAAFSFGNASGKILSLPKTNGDKSDRDGFGDINSSQISLPLASPNKLPENTERLANDKSTEKSIDIQSGRAVHGRHNRNANSSDAKLIKRAHSSMQNFPGRKNLSKEKDIFARHTQKLPEKQLSQDIPTGVATLLPTKALPPVQRSLEGGVPFPQFHLPIDRLSLILPRASFSESRLQTLYHAAARLAYGSNSAMLNRQQFVLPGFRYQAQVSLNPNNAPIRSQQSSSAHPLLKEFAENNSLPKRKKSQLAQSQNQYNYNNIERNPSFSQYKSDQYRTSLYYPAPTYPGWQRPYYRNTKLAYSPGNYMYRSNSSTGTSYPVLPRFYSYYD